MKLSDLSNNGVVSLYKLPRNEYKTVAEAFELKQWAFLASLFNQYRVFAVPLCLTCPQGIKLIATYTPEIVEAYEAGKGVEEIDKKVEVEVSPEEIAPGVDGAAPREISGKVEVDDPEQLTDDYNTIKLMTIDGAKQAYKIDQLIEIINFFEIPVNGTKKSDYIKVIQEHQ